MMFAPLLLAGLLPAGNVDLVLGPGYQSAAVGATVEVSLTASALPPSTDITAIDAILSWDPAQLQFIEADTSGSPYAWFQAGFFPDPDGINADVFDGEALYTLLGQITTPASVPPDLEGVVFRFQVISSGVVSLKASSGVFGLTRVLGTGINNNVTGDISAIACVAGPSVSYCTAGTSSNGCTALLSSTGLASATASSGFVVTASGLEGAKNGTFFTGVNGRQANPWGNGSSFQCVVPPVQRAGSQLASGTPNLCDGIMARDFNALWCPSTCPKPVKNPGAGATVQVQLWYRDPLNTSNQTTSLSDALEFKVGP